MCQVGLGDGGVNHYIKPLGSLHPLLLLRRPIFSSSVKTCDSMSMYTTISFVKMTLNTFLQFVKNIQREAHVVLNELYLTFWALKIRFFLS